MNQPTNQPLFSSLNSLAEQLRKDLNGTPKLEKTTQQKEVKAIKGVDFVLLFAHNGIGKTRLSMDFKDIGKLHGRADTLYFNAFTEDLFDWDNDLENDQERRLKFKSHSRFFRDLEGMNIGAQIRPILHQYTDLEFEIDEAESIIIFQREVLINGKNEAVRDIKISRGEENIFIWCFFLAIAQLVIDAEEGEPYDWVKFIYIDDPISSLDEHNAIAVASQLARILKEGKDKVKVVISTHHGLFFNVMFNELKTGTTITGERYDIPRKAYVLHRPQGGDTYTLQDTGETPYLHHIFVLLELNKVAESGEIYPHHFNMLRSVLEKTAVFFGSQHISTCFDGVDEKALYSRFLNVKSHTKYSFYDPVVLPDEDKKMFKDMLKVFLSRFPFSEKVFSTKINSPEVLAS